MMAKDNDFKPQPKPKGLSARGLFCLLLVLLIAFPQNSQAQTDTFETLSDEELLEQGWESRQVKANPDGVKCGLWAMLISPFWRGYGHHCIGDTESHHRLLAMEGLSLGLIATALTIAGLSKDDKYLSGLWRPLFHFGTALFASSYLYDLIGTFKGNSFTFDDNQRNPLGHQIRLGLRWLPSSNFNLGLELDYEYRNTRFWVKPYAYLDVAKLESFYFGTDLGLILYHGEKNYSYIALATDLSFNDTPLSFREIKFIPYLELSLDLGSILEHLSDLRFINRLGIGANFYDFRRSSLYPYEDHDLLLVLESELSLNVLKDLNFAFIYRYRPDFSVGQISGPSRIFNTLPVPGLGIFSIQMGFYLGDNWNGQIEANFGSSIDFWLTVGRLF